MNRPRRTCVCHPVLPDCGPSTDHKRRDARCGIGLATARLAAAQGDDVALAYAARAELGGIDVLVNSAGDRRGRRTAPDGAVTPFAGGTAINNILKWEAALTSPMPMKVAFDVRVTPDSLSGQFTPGRFPPGPVTGVRL